MLTIEITFHVLVCIQLHCLGFFPTSTLLLNIYSMATYSGESVLIGIDSLYDNRNDLSLAHTCSLTAFNLADSRLNLGEDTIYCSLHFHDSF